MGYPHPMDDKTGFEATDEEMGLDPRKHSTSTGWLIEHPDTSHSVRYYSLRPGSSEFWTTNHEAALRFARRCDANDFWQMFGDEDIAARVVEHAWDRDFPRHDWLAERN